MLSQSEIKTAANKLLGGVTGLKVYGKEITEGYQTPSLFVEIVPKPFNRLTQGYAKSGFSLKITYFQKTPDEKEQLKLVDTVKEAFGMTFAVGNRKLTVGDIEYDYVGQKEDILQISVDFEFYENTVPEESGEIAETLSFMLEKEDEDEYIEVTGN
jgi:hypothetical protein